MRTKNLLMAVTALLIASCSQNEITEVRTDGNPAVGFDVYTGVATRGTDVTNTTMQGTVDNLGGFGVMGYYTGSKTWEQADKSKITPSFMFNQLVTYDTDKWTYSPIKYWPNNKADKVSFFAYAPYEYNETDKKRAGIVTSGNTDAGVPFINFTLKEVTNLDKMVDLVVAKVFDKSANDSEIKFNFEHILSKIGFQVKLGDEYTGLDGTNSFIYITHMWVVGKTSTNSVSVSKDNPLVNASSRFYKKATWKDLHWNYNDADIAQEDFDLSNLLNKDKTGITEIWEDGTEKTIQGIKLTKDNKTENVNLFPADQYLYLIPMNETAENMTTGCKTDEIQIGFHYDIVTKTSDSPADTPKYLVSHFENAVSLPATHLQRGKFYTYTFVINLKEITISEAKVGTWDSTPGSTPLN